MLEKSNTHIMDEWVIESVCEIDSLFYRSRVGQGYIF